MDAVYVIAAIAVGLLLAELLLPTGGLLALIGALGLVAAGVVAFTEDSDAFGAGLVTLGILSLGAVWIVTPKIIRAHRDEPVRTGWEELARSEGEVRDPLNPDGQIWIDGALWKARVADGEPELGIGNRVRVESVDGLTLVVKPVGDPEAATKGT